MCTSLFTVLAISCPIQSSPVSAFACSPAAVLASELGYANIFKAYSSFKVRYKSHSSVEAFLVIQSKPWPAAVREEARPEVLCETGQWWAPPQDRVPMERGSGRDRGGAGLLGKWGPKWGSA